MKEVTSHFVPHPVLSSQLSHSASEFDQYVKPDADKAPRDEHERLSKHPATGRHTHTHTHTLFFSFMCQSLTTFRCSVLVIKKNKKKGSNHKNQQCTHSGLPPTSLPAPRVPFISIMERRKLPAQDCRWHLHHPAFLKVPTNLSIWQNSQRCHF